jgi:hypothetical protein
MTPLDVLERLPQPVTVPPEPRQTQRGSPSDESFDAAIRQARKPRREPDAPPPEPARPAEPPDEQTDAQPSPDEAAAEAGQASAGSDGQPANREAGADGGGEQRGPTGEAGGDAKAEGQRADAGGEHGPHMPGFARVAVTNLLRLPVAAGLNLTREVAAPSDVPASEGTELQQPAGRPTSSPPIPTANVEGPRLEVSLIPQAQTQDRSFTVRKEPVEVPQQPMRPAEPLGEDVGHPTGNRGPGVQSAAGQLVDLKADEPSREARAAGDVNAPAIGAPQLGSRGAASTSPAVELAQLLAPEARLSELPRTDRATGETARLGLGEGGQQPLLHVAESRGTSAVISAARVVDAYDSLVLRSAGDAGQVEGSTPVDRLTRVLASSAGPRTSYVKLQLVPPGLGELRIEVRLNQGAMSVRVQTETAGVRDLMSDRIGELRTSLEQHGIHLDRVTIEMRPSSSNANVTGEETNEQHAGDHGAPASQDQPNAQGDRSSQGGSDDNDAGAPESYDLGRSGTAESGGLVTAESSVDVFV